MLFLTFFPILIIISHDSVHIDLWSIVSFLLFWSIIEWNIQTFNEIRLIMMKCMKCMKFKQMHYERRKKDNTFLLEHHRMSNIFAQHFDIIFDNVTFSRCLWVKNNAWMSDFKIQSNSVITNSSGPAISVRYNRVNLCTNVTNLP